MTDPVDLDAYLKRFHMGELIEGYGFGNVYMTSPCPFCAAPGWLKWEMLDVRPAMEKGATCSECGRSARAIFKDDHGRAAFEIVQTGGDDPPEYLVPKMRRV
jgi:hypothetical protein